MRDIPDDKWPGTEKVKAEFFRKRLPAGWTESRPGALACNPDPVNGGIIDKAFNSSWFIVFNREDLPVLEGFASRAEAFERFFAEVDKVSK